MPRIDARFADNLFVPNDLIHLIYVSAATADLTDLELKQILFQARRNNDRLGITGMLVHSEGSFLQVLEGPSNAIGEILHVIGQDVRHARLMKLIEEPIAERAFQEWTMGFAEMNPGELQEIPGCNDFFRQGNCLQDVDAGKAKTILQSFRKRAA